MKLPRDLKAIHLIKKLEVYGYEVNRQKGSHIRLVSTKRGVHHLTIPNHSPLKTGTLSNILKAVADHFQITKEEVIKSLFY
jgi:predicted RNA binding protein YcfA (HicA-like mRNA interferase family)